MEIVNTEGGALFNEPLRRARFKWIKDPHCVVVVRVGMNDRQNHHFAN